MPAALCSPSALPGSSGLSGTQPPGQRAAGLGCSAQAHSPASPGRLLQKALWCWKEPPPFSLGPPCSHCPVTQVRSKRPKAWNLEQEGPLSSLTPSLTDGGAGAQRGQNNDLLSHSKLLTGLRTTPRSLVSLSRAPEHSQLTPTHLHQGLGPRAVKLRWVEGSIEVGPANETVASRSPCPFSLGAPWMGCVQGWGCKGVYPQPVAVRWGPRSLLTGSLQPVWVIV